MTDPTTPDLIALAQRFIKNSQRGRPPFIPDSKEVVALAQLVLDQKKELDHIRALANVDPDCPLREALR